MKRYLEAGKVNNTHGLNGFIKFAPWFDSFDVALEIKTLYIQNHDGYKPIQVEKASIHQNVLLMKLEGYDDFENAIRLKNKILYCDRYDVKIKEGSFFIADLIGLNVIDADTGKIYGKLNNVHNYGASDIYEIENENKCLVYMPAVKEFVISIDLETGIYVRLIEGMLE